MSPMMCGGCSESVPADAPVQKLCDEVKAAVQLNTKKDYAVFTAKTYTKQVVSGTNYFIKVHVGGDDYIHIRVYEKLGCHGGGVEFHGVRESKNHDDPVEYFS